VTLLSQLYELRQDPRLRAARERILTDFFPQTLEDAKQKLTLGTEKNTEFPIAASYREVVAGIANRGLMDEDLYFETTLEPWVLFEKLRPILADWRVATKAPVFFSQLEEHCKRLEASREKRAPGAMESFRQRLAPVAKARAAVQR
jgi:hypothetical protein